VPTEDVALPSGRARGDQAGHRAAFDVIS